MELPGLGKLILIFYFYKQSNLQNLRSSLTFLFINIMQIRKKCTFCSWLYSLSFSVQKIFYDINKDHRTFPFPLRSQVKLNCFSSNMKMEYKIINCNNFLTPNSICWEAKFCKTIFYNNSLQITKTKRNFLLQNLLSHAQDNEVYVLKVTHNHVSPSAIKC